MTKLRFLLPCFLGLLLTLWPTVAKAVNKIQSLTTSQGIRVFYEQATMSTDTKFTIWLDHRSTATKIGLPGVAANAWLLGGNTQHAAAEMEALNNTNTQFKSQLANFSTDAAQVYSREKNPLEFKINCPWNHCRTSLPILFNVLKTLSLIKSESMLPKRAH